MGKYSRKDMIEFANFAKSYQSSRNVEEAYAAYLSGTRLVTHHDFGNSLYKTIQRANKVFVDDKCVKSRNPDETIHFKNLHLLAIESWDSELKIIRLKRLTPRK